MIYILEFCAIYLFVLFFGGLIAEYPTGLQKISPEQKQSAPAAATDRSAQKKNRHHHYRW